MKVMYDGDNARVLVNDYLSGRYWSPLKGLF